MTDSSETKPNDGGPAFPRAATPAQSNMVGGSGHWMSVDLGHPGMSLRDAFALGALPALADDYQSKPEVIAKRAYDIADALLSAREVKNGK